MPAATVTTVPALPQQSTRFNGREGKEPATVCLIQTFYVVNEGKLQLPVSGPRGTKAEIVELCAPYGMKYVQWVVARNGLLPEFPDYEVLGKGETLAGYQFSPIAPGIKIDGLTYEFGASGVYVYYCDLPPDKEKGFAMGRRSFDNRTGKVARSNNFSQHWRG